MRAVVLVGGFGTRLRPLTNHVPKPMLPVGHVPIIARLVSGLARGGVHEVTLALGFKPEPFAEAFPDHRELDERFTRLNALRNVLNHGERWPADTVREEGEAAIAWFRARVGG